MSYIEKKIDKLPLSKKYLETVQESVEEFQIRRVYAVCNKLYERYGELIEWRIKRSAGLKNNISSRVQDTINAYVSNKNI